MFALAGFAGWAMPTFDGRPWTNDELGTLRMLAADGWDKVEIADVIKRTVMAVAAKATKLKVKFPHGKHATRRFEPAEDEALRKMAADGYSPRTITTKLRRGIRGIERRARILGIEFAGSTLRKKRNPGYLGWSKPRIELAKQRWQAGWAARVIAEELGHGITKNAVVGKMNRLKCRKPRKEIKRAARQPRRRRPMPKLPPGTFVLPPLNGHGWLYPPKGPSLPAIPTGDVAHVLHNDLEPQHCRWPIGDPHKVAIHREPYYCGAPRKEGLPYCREHCRRAFTHVSRIPRHTYPTPGIV